MFLAGRRRRGVSVRRAFLLGALVLGGGQAAAPAPAPAPPAPAVAVRHLAPGEAAGVLGARVVSAKGEQLGRIIDVLVDQQGHPRAAVIDFGGFLGIGNRKIAVDWKSLHFATGKPDSPVTLDLSADQIKATPDYKESASKPAAVAAPKPASAPITPPAPAPAPAPPPAKPAQP